MSFQTSSTTFSIPSQLIPIEFSSLAEFESFIEINLKENDRYFEQKDIFHERDVGEQLLVLHGTSRSGWFLNTINNLATYRKAIDLSFLKSNCFNQKFALDYSSYQTYSILNLSQIDAAISEITNIFEWAKNSPDYLIPLMPGFEIPAQLTGAEKEDYVMSIREMILESVQDDIISICPDIFVGYAEDGIGPGYLFTFLRTLQVLLLSAKSKKYAVIHLQVIPA